MIAVHSEAEAIVLEHATQLYKPLGFELSNEKISPFTLGVRGYLPDFVFKRGEERIAVEAKVRRTQNLQRSLEDLKKEIEQLPNWKFEYFFADELRDKTSLNKVGMDAITASLRQVREVLSANQVQAGFLLSWAIFEAVARFKMPKSFQVPQSPGRIITVLAEAGSISPSEADTLRALSSKRNLLIHGKLDEVISIEEANTLIMISERLIVSTNL
ncbi:hypothetical protein [Pseudotabrizicola sp. 4114]|uniref:hypothetical protein n=1 Tax=Pseudotabrizicola sp. 4114 TaxID=2817731 RepID=UPI00285B8638|nr:hypothetical protein [Pseudorhodobacter sp. 4114]